MFWGLIMEPSKRYSQKVKKAFHISMASQDVSSLDEQPSQVLCSYEGRNYLLCTLQYPSVMQCPLDLNFDVGTEVSFATNGKGHIHLTGYTLDDDDDSLTVDQLAEEEESEEEVVVEKQPKKSKKKNQDSSPEVPVKKAKLLNGSASEEVEEEESDDPDFEEAEDEESGEEEEEGEEDEEDEDEDTDSDNEVVEEESEAQAPVKQEKSKKGKQQKQQQEAAKVNKPKRHLFGVVTEDIVIGTGPEAKPGRFVTIHFEGRLQKTNKVFDSCTVGPGFKYRLGRCEVIKGLDIGVEGMKVGGKRKITCPALAGYGPKGSLPTIPPNSALVFTVTLKKVK